MSNNRIPIKKSEKKKGVCREYSEAIITAVIIALVIRSFGFEAFKIPSSSMVPTLMVGDHIFVNKFIYGMRIPLTKYRFVTFKKPERGDVIVFMYPRDEKMDYIKRVVGEPGDHVRVEGMDIFVNDEKVRREALAVEPSDKIGRLSVSGSEDYKYISKANGWNDYDYFEETISDNDFVAQYDKYTMHRGDTVTVPEGHYFVMGDNRDNSRDSREWGFVPSENVKGKAMFVWLSFDSELLSAECKQLRLGTDSKVLYWMECVGKFFGLLFDMDSGFLRGHRFGKWIR